MTANRTELEGGHLRLRRLYDISKLLTRFDGVETTLPEVIAVAAQGLPVRSAVLLLAGAESVHSYVWKIDDFTVRELAGVLAHARATHAYFSGRAPLVPTSVDPDEAPTSIHGLPRVADGATRVERRFIVLPLIVERRRVFGAIQFEAAAALDETDLVFVNAVANQLAVAIDRHLKSDEAKAIAEKARVAAVDASLRSSARLDLTRALSGSLDGQTTFAALARCTVPSFADVVLVDELTPSGQMVRMETGFADSARGATIIGRLLAVIPAMDIQEDALATKTPVLVEDLSDVTISLDSMSARDASLLRQLGARSMLVVPLRAHGRTLGVATFARAETDRNYTAHDLAFAEAIAQQAAATIDNARAHQKTEEAVRQRQDILAMVSHDLRSPLNTVLLAAHTLISTSAGRSPTETRTLEIIRRSARHMVRMTNDLLDLSSIEAGHLSIDRQATDIQMLVEEVAEAERPAISKRGLLLVLDLPSAELVASCDRDRILQVLGNLIGNATKFTPREGTITVRAERRADAVHFEVADTGRGIAKDLLPHLFSRYLQARGTAAQGRGLGLFISKGIIEAHGGVLGVRSEENKGATFFFTLPTASRLERVAASAPQLSDGL